MQFSLDLDPMPFLPLIRTRLLVCYGPQRDSLRLDPVSQLVLAIISARTRDEISLQAFERLARRYRPWSALAHASPPAIEKIIRPVTYADVKATHLPQALQLIEARTGGLDLSSLQGWPEENAMRWLEDLPGVGTRNAATTLNFSKLRKRTLSVGTHLLRVGERLGLLPPRTDYGRGYAIFMRLVPDAWDGDDIYEFHWLMKYHGQRVCTHTAPACGHCALHDLCPHARPSVRAHRAGLGADEVEASAGAWASSWPKMA
jgi:endonuclease-3